MPAYAGPTPANPFGGGTAFDIFDAIEQAEQERALAATGAARRPPEPAAPLPATEDGPTEPEPVIAEPIAIAPETMSLGEADPAIDSAASEAEPDTLPDAPGVVPVAAPPVTEPVMAAGAEPMPEPVGGPLIVPTLIDGNASPAEKRRGWWRR